MKNPHIYIDDSGNLHNTQMLVIAILYFKDRDIIDSLASTILQFIQKRFKNKSTELHFNKESIQTKTLFFKLIYNKTFILRFYATDKRNINLSSEEHIIQSILLHKDMCTQAKVFIDGDTSQNRTSIMARRIKTKIKEHGIFVKSLKFEDSKRNVLIQLADMCAGCIRRKLERNTTDDRRLFDMIRKFIQR